MGLTKEEAQKLLGVPDGAPCFIIRKRYKKLAHRFYPERNLRRKEYALKKFQKIVEAYVRLNIDPDDCDQMKIKHILLEIYSYHDDIAGDDSDLFSDDSEGADVGSVSSDDYFQRFDSYPASAFDSNNGPYSALLQDFTLRSYMSGERKSKNYFSSSRKSYVSEEDRIVASQHAEELLKNVEEERRKDDTRKQKNKKKKEAKKKRKDKFQNESWRHKLKQQHSDNSESSSESDLDMDSAFFARVTSKVPVLSQTSNLVWNDNESLSENETEEENGGTTPPQLESPKIGENDKDTNDGLKEHRDGVKNKNVTVRTIPRTEMPWDARGKSRTYQHYNNGYQSELPPRLQKKLATECRNVSNGSNAVSKKNNGDQQRTDYSSKGEKTRSTVQHRQTVKKDTESAIDKSRRLAVQGNKAAKEGQFGEAVISFTEAIDLYSKDERYFGNRSFCYDYLKDYQRALEDSDVAIQLKSDWPKGHFRRGKALIGLKQYKEAEVSLQRAVGLDPNYHDAAEELKKVLEILYSTQIGDNGSPVKEITVQSKIESFTLSNKIGITQPGVIENSQPIIEAARQSSLKENSQSSYYQDNSRPLLYLESTSPPGFDQTCQTNSNSQVYYGQTSFEITGQSSIETPPINQPTIVQTNQEMFGRTSQSDFEQVRLPDFNRRNDNASYNVDSNSILPEGDPPLYHNDTTSDIIEKSSSVASDGDNTGVNDTEMESESGNVSNTVWISDVDSEMINDKMLFQMFKSCGRIMKIEVLTDQSCAYVRFDKPASATVALNKYKGASIAGCQVTMRYSDYPLPTLKSKTYVHHNNKRPVPVSKGECHYWRLNGCYYGKSCRFIHIPKNRGIDLKQRKPFNKNKL